MKAITEPPDENEPLPLEIRLEQNRARGHLQWAREEIMKLGSKLMAVLKEVHDKRSYRFDYSSFEDYCAKEWKITASRAYQIIKGENFRALLMDAGCPDDMASSLNERQIDALSKTTPPKAIKILRKISKSGDRITARAIAHEVNPDVIPPVRHLCPHCHQPMPVRKKASSIPD